MKNVRTSRAESIPVEQIAAAVDASGLSLSDICRNLGWMDSDKQPSTSRLQRRLGRLHNSTTQKCKVYSSRQKTVSYSLAAKIVKAAGMDPVDFGL